MKTVNLNPAAYVQGGLFATQPVVGKIIDAMFSPDPPKGYTATQRTGGTPLFGVFIIEQEDGTVHTQHWSMGSVGDHMVPAQEDMAQLAVVNEDMSPNLTKGSNWAHLMESMVAASPAIATSLESGSIRFLIGTVWMFERKVFERKGLTAPTGEKQDPGVVVVSKRLDGVKGAAGAGAGAKGTASKATAPATATSSAAAPATSPAPAGKLTPTGDSDGDTHQLIQTQLEGGKTLPLATLRAMAMAKYAGTPAANEVIKRLTDAWVLENGYQIVDGKVAMPA